VTPAIPISLKPRLGTGRGSVARSHTEVPIPGKERERLSGTIVLALILASSAIALYDLSLLAKFTSG
jgi:hypothetical protein